MKKYKLHLVNIDVIKLGEYLNKTFKCKGSHENRLLRMFLVSLAESRGSSWLQKFSGISIPGE